MKDADAQMRRRAELAEHPFGTLKCRAGYRHFLVRGFDKVRGEWSLMALCYNFSRVLSILGFDNFMAYLANGNPYWASFAAKNRLGHHHLPESCRTALPSQNAPKLRLRLIISAQYKFFPSLCAPPIPRDCLRGKRRCKPRTSHVARMCKLVQRSLRAQRSNPPLHLRRYGLLRCARNDVVRPEPGPHEA